MGVNNYRSDAQANQDSEDAKKEIRDAIQWKKDLLWPYQLIKTDQGKKCCTFQSQYTEDSKEFVLLNPKADKSY